MDLLVLADALLLPDDDLALATVLKSPLFGLSEEELFELAWTGEGTCEAALRERRPDLAARLDALRERRASLSPFAFYAGLLGAGGGRKAFLARLGSRGERRPRRISQPGARLRTPRDAVAAGLRRVAAHRVGRGQARHGNGARRGAGDDGAWRQGAGGADRRAGRHHDACRGPPYQPRLLQLPRRRCAAADLRRVVPRPTDDTADDRGAGERRDRCKPRTNTAGCSTSR